MLGKTWKLLKESVSCFIADDALSRGAAMAFYAVTSLAPILLIVVAIAGLAFGRDAAQNAIVAQFSGLMGAQSAELLQGIVKGAAGKSSGMLATAIGVGTLLVTASGVFGEMQATLNAIWKVPPSGSTVSRLIRARAASLGLVAALGFLLLVSLAASAAISALGGVIDAHVPFGKLLLSVVNTVVSFALISLLFAAIYKVLPDRDLEWHDVGFGAVATAALFTLGKTLIGWYLGSSTVASSYGAAGALIIVLLWVYYSSEIFLLGAEFTRAYSRMRRGERAASEPELAQPVAARPALSAAPGEAATSPLLALVAGVLVALAFVRERRGVRTGR
jgi:membrane protein